MLVPKRYILLGLLSSFQELLYFSVLYSTEYSDFKNRIEFNPCLFLIGLKLARFVFLLF